MDTSVDIQGEDPVVVVDGRERYHRVSAFSSRKTACDRRCRAATHVVQRSDAERDGYDPCSHQSCFGGTSLG